MVKFNNKVFKNSKKSQKYKKNGLVILITEKWFKCMQRNCSCKTFWSTFLVPMFERACYSHVPLQFTIRQSSCNVHYNNEALKPLSNNGARLVLGPLDRGPNLNKVVKSNFNKKINSVCV